MLLGLTLLRSTAAEIPTKGPDDSLPPLFMHR